MINKTKTVTMRMKLAENTKKNVMWPMKLSLSTSDAMKIVLGVHPLFDRDSIFVRMSEGVRD